MKVAFYLLRTAIVGGFAGWIVGSVVMGHVTDNQGLKNFSSFVAGVVAAVIFRRFMMRSANG